MRVFALLLVLLAGALGRVDETKLGLLEQRLRRLHEDQDSLTRTEREKLHSLERRVGALKGNDRELEREEEEEEEADDEADEDDESRVQEEADEDEDEPQRATPLDFEEEEADEDEADEDEADEDEDDSRAEAAAEKLNSAQQTLRRLKRMSAGSPHSNSLLPGADFESEEVPKVVAKLDRAMKTIASKPASVQASPTIQQWLDRVTKHMGELERSLANPQDAEREEEEESDEDEADEDEDEADALEDVQDASLEKEDDRLAARLEPLAEHVHELRQRTPSCAATRASAPWWPRPSARSPS